MSRIGESKEVRVIKGLSLYLISTSPCEPCGVTYVLSTNSLLRVVYEALVEQIQAIRRSSSKEVTQWSSWELPNRNVVRQFRVALRANQLASVDIPMERHLLANLLLLEYRGRETLSLVDPSRSLLADRASVA